MTLTLPQSALLDETLRDLGVEPDGYTQPRELTDLLIAASRSGWRIVTYRRNADDSRALTLERGDGVRIKCAVPWDANISAFVAALPKR